MTNSPLKERNLPSGKLIYVILFNNAAEAPLWDRYAIQLLTPASILARLAGRDQIEIEDIGEMNELFLDAKTSASLIGQSGDFAP